MSADSSPEAPQTGPEARAGDDRRALWALRRHPGIREATARRLLIWIRSRSQHLLLYFADFFPPRNVGNRADQWDYIDLASLLE